MNDWIPCSKILPEFYTDVLVCFHDKRKGCERDYYFISAYIVHDVWEPTVYVDLTDLEAVAWMPLPEPYREGEAE